MRIPDSAKLSSQLDGIEVLSLIGAGGMGIVYRARRIDSGREIALKILPRESARGVLEEERFLRAARTHARLEHPNIVTIEQAGETPDFLYLVMELVDGANLRELIHEGGLSAHEALRIMLPICDAIQYAHDQETIHRDIKPDNILIDPDGEPKIVDFGLAKSAAITESHAYSLTATSDRMGTLAYMAPEQSTSTGDVDHRADIYSLGATFYEMLTGDRLTVHYEPASRKSGLPKQIDQIVRRCVEPTPANRYQQAKHLKGDIEALSQKSGRRVATSSVVTLAVFVLVGLVGWRILATAPDHAIANQSAQASRAVWSDPRPMVPESSSFYMSGPHLSPDGLRLWFYQYYDSPTGQYPALCRTTRTSDDAPFGAPARLGAPIDGQDSDGMPLISCDPTLTADELLLAFSSNRPHQDGPNGSELWLCHRDLPGKPWSTPVRFGPGVNSADNEWEPAFSSDGLTLLFHSDRPGGHGGTDLWLSRRESRNEPFGPATNLGPAVNGPKNEGGAALSADGRVLVFHRVERAGNTLWKAERASPEAPFNRAEPILAADSGIRRGIAPMLSASGELLLFAAPVSGGFEDTSIYTLSRKR